MSNKIGYDFGEPSVPYGEAVCMDLFQRENKICDNREALRDTYIPENLPGREQQLKDYEFTLDSVLDGDPINNVIARSP